MSLADLLAAAEPGFAGAESQWHFRFPDDHGAHPEFRSETWHLTGALSDESASVYGFQLTFIRLGLAPAPPQRRSAWASSQVYGALFALTDVTGGTVETFQRVSRAALGLAGAQEQPVRLWVEDWLLEATGTDGFRLQAGAADLRLALSLTGIKPPFLQGDLEQRPGLAQRGQGGFHSYLMPRLDARGVLRIADEERPVSGTAWLDRAWGEIPVAGGQLTFNRLTLQLDDGRDLMCLDLRRRAGGGTPIPSCVMIAADGSARRFGRRQVRMEPTGEWRSPLDGTRYPVRWRILIPDQELELAVVPLVDDQELDFAFRAWSGAVSVEGVAGAVTVTGRGQLELTGYALAPESSG
jgi:predicted secreted hydrolase